MTDETNVTPEPAPVEAAVEARPTLDAADIDAVREQAEALLDEAETLRLSAASLVRELKALTACEGGNVDGIADALDSAQRAGGTVVKKMTRRRKMTHLEFRKKLHELNISQRRKMTHLEFRKKLHELNISQRQFSQIVQMNIKTVNNWATGKQALPYWVRLLLDHMIKFQETVDGNKGQKP